ncbi:hypothetical protein [Streptomyces cavernae]|uniref:hypothetical protein n=1 Tax=Streptomyces cavernae TaxID=2259034 RepID=UPI000FEC06A1|nr:hypothetical protein [Streptomyces cavernae]
MPRGQGDDEVGRGAVGECIDEVFLDVGQALVAFGGRREASAVGGGEVRLGEPFGLAAAASREAQ